MPAGGTMYSVKSSTKQAVATVGAVEGTMKTWSQLWVFFCMCSLNFDLRGTYAGCVVPDVTHLSRTPTAVRINSHQSVTYTCYTPYIHIYGPLTITCTDKEDVFDKEPPVCGLPEYVLYVYENRGVSGGLLRDYRSLSRCLQACNDDPTCDAVDWDGMCWFHYSSTSCSDLTFGKNLHHYQLKQCFGNPAYGCLCSTGGTCERTYTSPTQISSEECVCNLGRTGDKCSDYVECNAQTIPNAAPSPATAIYRFGSNITYTCNSGYQLSDGSGSSFTLTCSLRGEFKGERKSCNRTCEILPLGDHQRQVTQHPVIFEGQTVSYTCGTGFLFNDTSTVKNLTCQADGTFDQSLPSCVPISCGFPSNSFHLKLAEEGPYDYGQNVTFSCIPGYHFAGYDVNGSFTSQCIATDTLEPPIPDCIRRPCTLPDLDESVTANRSTKLFFLDFVLFSCRQGLFFVDGAANKTLKCDETGGFGNDSLVCGVIQRKEVTPEALAGQVPVAVAISGWISTAVVLILVGVVVVVIKRRRNPTSQSFADKDHSDTSGLNQNCLSPPGSVDRDHEYMSLEANTMATSGRVTEYANDNDTYYTAPCVPANEINQRQPTAASIYQNDV